VNGSDIEAAARDLGIKPEDVERWLEQILDTWRQVNPDRMIEPWDYRYVSGEADRALGNAIPPALLLPLNERYYKDLGADPEKLGVLYDIDPRPGKSPVTYMDVVTMGWTARGGLPCRESRQATGEWALYP
jgi:hypothetical protein